VLPFYRLEDARRGFQRWSHRIRAELVGPAQIADNPRMTCSALCAGAMALMAIAWSTTLPVGQTIADPRRPELPASVLTRAARSIAEGHPADALRELQPLVQDHPDSATLHHHLGLAYEKQQRYELGAERFGRALELDPRLHEARAPLGWCLYYLGRLDSSREVFERYLAIVPTDAGALLALGLIEFDADRIDTARSRFLQAIELTRVRDDVVTQALLRARLADVEQRAGQLEAARRLLVVAIKLDPHNQSYYYKLARVLQRIGDADGARRVLARRDEILVSGSSKAPGP
jgi:tetratricopeptide (TPR) repeat protein